MFFFSLAQVQLFVVNTIFYDRKLKKNKILSFILRHYIFFHGLLYFLPSLEPKTSSKLDSHNNRLYTRNVYDEKSFYLHIWFCVYGTILRYSYNYHIQCEVCSVQIELQQFPWQGSAGQYREGANRILMPAREERMRLQNVSSCSHLPGCFCAVR